jgi:hypothetical protein
MSIDLQITEIGARWRELQEDILYIPICCVRARPVDRFSPRPQGDLAHNETRVQARPPLRETSRVPAESPSLQELRQRFGHRPDVPGAEADHEVARLDAVFEERDHTSLVGN